MIAMRTVGLIIAAPFLVMGCLLGPNYEPPDPYLPEEFSAEFAADTEDLDQSWWLGFEDATLNTLIQQSLYENRDINEALARLRQAEALLGAERSDLYPTLDGFANAGVRDDLNEDGDRVETSSVGLLFGFIPDIFGRQRRQVEAAQARLRARVAELADIERITAAEVARQYVAYRRAEQRLDLLETSLELQSQTLSIVELRRDAGLAADLDVQRAAADFARTRAQRGTLVISQQRAEQALAVLSGRTSSQLALDINDVRAIPAFGGGPPIGAPANLVRQRPDVLAAEAQLIAATASIGVETADLYPSLRIPGQLSANASSADAVGSSVVGTLSAQLDIPLFDFGRRRAEVTAAEQGAVASLRNYEQTLLQSLAEVENALVAIQSFEERQRELLIAVQTSEDAFEQLNALYREGLATFIDVLDAQRSLISNREAYVDSQADLASSIITLYEAVGAPAELESAARDAT